MVILVWYINLISSEEGFFFLFFFFSTSITRFGNPSLASRHSCAESDFTAQLVLLSKNSFANASTTLYSAPTEYSNDFRMYEKVYKIIVLIYNSAVPNTWWIDWDPRLCGISLAKSWHASALHNRYRLLCVYGIYKHIIMYTLLAGVTYWW